MNSGDKEKKSASSFLSVRKEEGLKLPGESGALIRDSCVSSQQTITACDWNSTDGDFQRFEATPQVWILPIAFSTTARLVA